MFSIITFDFHVLFVSFFCRQVAIDWGVTTRYCAFSEVMFSFLLKYTIEIDIYQWVFQWYANDIDFNKLVLGSKSIKVFVVVYAECFEFKLCDNNVSMVVVYYNHLIH